MASLYNSLRNRLCNNNNKLLYYTKSFYRTIRGLAYIKRRELFLKSYENEVKVVSLIYTVYVIICYLNGM